MPKSILSFFIKLLFAFLTLYVALFFSAPFIMKSLIDKKLGDYGVALEIKSVSYELRTAKARIEGFRLTHLGKPLAGFDSLDCDFSFYSFANRAFIVDAISIDGLRLYARRDQNGSFNFQKIFPATDKEGKNAPPFYFSLNNINLKNVNIEYIDDILKQNFTLSKTDISLPFISTIPHDTEIFTRPSAKGFLNGSPFAFKAKSRPLAKDLKSELELVAHSVDLSVINSFLPRGGEVKDVEGKLSFAAKLSFEKAAKSKILLNADANLTEFAIKTQNATVSLGAASIRKLLFSPENTNLFFSDLAL
ncbi:MAG TPA: DUF748 domain-containing protein, partial [Campylobacterales bacterium]|nr:DUF748 domain-containing protein [Campylobacterales bacterium]